MVFIGTWMPPSETSIYRAEPKCACSTIGQILYYGDHGHFYDGDIHDATEGMHKWALEESQPLISRRVLAHDTYTFTFVRNPYARILSSFFDKICGIQRNGKRYRGTLVPMLIQRYGIETGTPENNFEFDQIKSFRRFLLFARDTIRWRRPMDPDIHWSPMSGQIATLVLNGGRYNDIFWTERFNKGMQSVLDAVDTPHPIDLAKVPRFNESGSHGPKRAHKIEDYFDDLSMHLVYEMYKQDFILFKYDPHDPSNQMPIGEIDLDEIHKKLNP